MVILIGMINKDMSALRVPRIELEKKKVKEEKKKTVKTPWIKRVFLLIALSFVLTNIFLLFENRQMYMGAIRYLRSIGRKVVIYDTYSIAFDDTVPNSFKDLMKENLGNIVLGKKPRFLFKDRKADFIISSTRDNEKEVIFSKDLIPVGHIYSLLTDIDLNTLKQKSVLILDSDIKEYIKEEYGIEAVLVDSKDSFVEEIAKEDSNIGLVSFNNLDYRMKIIPLDGKYYLDNSEGSLKINLYSSVNEEDRFILSVIQHNMNKSGHVSFDKGKLAKINMSGVVAIARNLAFKMESARDDAYAAEFVGDFLADADLTHVSNEASFVPGCKPTRSMAFCSNPKYVETLKKSGVDIVELTGNHNNDYGAKHSAGTIDMYKELGWDYFGGGLDKKDAEKILYKEVNGSKMAFIGYNYYDAMLNNWGPLAKDNSSGANAYSEEKLKRDVEEAKKNADIVIVTFQFQECYSYPDGDVIYPICYKPLVVPDQKGTFRKAIDLGADIVVGTQAHQPQTFELYNDGVIFYGLGNLYFDQIIWIGTRHGLVLTHYLYEGKHIQTKLTPIYQDKDFKVRLATKEQGDLLLKLLKNAR